VAWKSNPCRYDEVNLLSPSSASYEVFSVDT
jgi:hypothetical protein